MLNKSHIILMSSILLSFQSCDKIPVTTDVIFNLVAEPNEVPADGQSIITISCSINADASADRRKVIFSTTAGSFIESGAKTQTVQCQFENGLLVAKTRLRSSHSPGSFIIRVKPEFNSPAKDYTIEKTISSNFSQPNKILFEPSAFGIGSNFSNEVKLTGYLTNSQGKNVSNGVSVIIEDELLNGSNANGRFRENQLKTSDSSKVTTIYSASTHPIGTIIKIRAVVLDSTGNRTILKDSIYLNINM